MKLLLDKVNSPIGIIWVVSDGDRLCVLDFDDCQDRILQLLQQRYTDFSFQETTDPQGFSSQLQAYLNGELNALDPIPVNTGGTSFQQQVWTALRSIAIGQVKSYGELATQLGNANASRAVGLANSLNPVAIVLPCHRVIGANGKLIGYAGGLDRKRWLLQHEGVEVAALERSKLERSKLERSKLERSKLEQLSLL